MKILFLFHRNLETATGGVVEFLRQLPKALKKLGIASVIYTQTDKRLKKLIQLDPFENIPCYSGPFINPGWLTNSRKLRPILELCEKEKIDLIHAQTTYRAGFMAMKTHQKNHIPYLITSHNDILATNSDRMKRGKILRRCQKILKHAKGVTHLTSEMEKASHQIFDTSQKSFIIGNGIDLAEWKNYQNLSEKNYTLTMGRLEKGKGFNILIDAYEKLQKNGLKTSLVIAGDGSARQDLENQVKRLGLNLVINLQDALQIPESSVVFTGYVKGEAKKNLFAHSQFILFPTQPDTWEEAFSIVQLETMAAGKAMIASDTLPTRYLQSIGLQTQLVKADNVDAWAAEMKNLLEDHVVRKKLAMTNLQNVEPFDWSVIAKAYKKAYEHCL